VALVDGARTGGFVQQDAENFNRKARLFQHLALDTLLFSFPGFYAPAR
jgi:hypothetical protein